MAFDEDMKVTHGKGVINLEEIPEELLKKRRMIGDLGIQINKGKVWICINGFAFIRFSSEMLNYLENKEG